MVSEKTRPRHLGRKAILYIRQYIPRYSCWRGSLDKDLCTGRHLIENFFCKPNLAADRKPLGNRGASMDDKVWLGGALIPSLADNDP